MESVESLRMIGNSYFHKEKYGEAAFYYKRAIMADPKNAALHNNLAQALLYQNKFIEAEEHAKRAIELDVDAEKGYFRAAKAAEGYGDYHKAVEYIDRGLRLEKLASKIEFWNYRKLLYSKMHDRDGYSSDLEPDEEEEEVLVKPQTPIKKAVSKESKQVLVTKPKPVAFIDPPTKKGPIETSDIKGDKILQMVQNIIKEDPAEHKINFAKQKLKRKKMDFEQAVTEASDLLPKKQYVTAAHNYQEALDIISEYPAESMGLSSMTETVLKYSIVACWCQSVHVTLEQMSRSVEYLSKIRKMHTSERFPAVFYGYAKVYYKLNRFSRSVEVANAGLDVLKKEPLFQVHCWPGSATVIYETTREGLEAGLRAMIAECSVFHPADATCKHPPADCLRLSNQIVPSRQIYFSDVDFNGYMQITCQSKCIIDYHLICWRDFKESLSNDTGNKFTDKDVLGLPCPTEDCVAEPGKPSAIVHIAQIMQNGQIKFTVSKEPAGAAKEKPTKRKIESTKPPAPDKEKTATKPRVPPVRSRSTEKRPGLATANSKTATEEWVANDNDDTEALSIAVDDFFALRKRNFNYRQSQVWDPSAAFYGRRDLDAREFFRIPRPAALPRDFVLSYFLETLADRGPVLVADVEEIWTESLDDIPVFAELDGDAAFPGIVSYLTESYQFVVIGDTMGVAKRADALDEHCRALTAECVQFLLDEDAARAVARGRPPPRDRTDSGSSERPGSEVSLPERPRLDSARSDEGGAKCLDLLEEAEAALKKKTRRKRSRKNKGRSDDGPEADGGDDAGVDAMDLETAAALKSSEFNERHGAAGLPGNNGKMLADYSTKMELPAKNRTNSEWVGAQLITEEVVGNAASNSLCKTTSKTNKNLELAFDKQANDDNKKTLGLECASVLKTPTKKKKQSEVATKLPENDDGKKSSGVDGTKLVQTPNKKKKSSDLAGGLPKTGDCNKSLSLDCPNYVTSPTKLTNPTELPLVLPLDVEPIKSGVDSTDVEKTPKKKKKQKKKQDEITAVLATNDDDIVMPMEQVESVKEQAPDKASAETSANGSVKLPLAANGPSDWLNKPWNWIKHSVETSGLANAPTFLDSTFPSDESRADSLAASPSQAAKEGSVPANREKSVAEPEFPSRLQNGGSDDVLSCALARSAALVRPDGGKLGEFSDKFTNTVPNTISDSVAGSAKPQVVETDCQTELRGVQIVANETRIVTLTKERDDLQLRVKNSDEITSVLLDNRKAREEKIAELEATIAGKDAELVAAKRSARATSPTPAERQARLESDADAAALRLELVEATEARDVTAARLEEARNDAYVLAHELRKTRAELADAATAGAEATAALAAAGRDLDERKRDAAKMATEFHKVRAALNEIVEAAQKPSNADLALAYEKRELRAENGAAASAARAEIADLTEQRDRLRQQLAEKAGPTEEAAADVTEVLAATQASLDKVTVAKRQLEARLLASQQEAEALKMRLNYLIGTRSTDSTDPAVLFNAFVRLHMELGRIKADRCESEFARVLARLDSAQENKMVAELTKQTLWEMRAVLGEIYEKLLQVNSANQATYDALLSNPGKVGRIEDLPPMCAAQISDEVYAALFDVDENAPSPDAADSALPKPPGPSGDARREHNARLGLRHAPNHFMTRPPPFHPFGPFPMPQYAFRHPGGGRPFNPLAGPPMFAQPCRPFLPVGMPVVMGSGDPGRKRSTSQGSGRSSPRAALKVDEVRRPPTKTPTISAIVTDYAAGDKTSSKTAVTAFDSLMQKLSARFPKQSVPELQDCLREIRKENNNTLQGLSMELIVKKTRDQLTLKSQKPAWAPVATAEDEGRWHNPLDDPECVICMEVMRPPGTTALPCDHIFHARCIKKWLSINSVCPTCKRHTKMDDEYPPLK